MSLFSLLRFHGMAWSRARFGYFTGGGFPVQLFGMTKHYHHCVDQSDSNAQELTQETLAARMTTSSSCAGQLDPCVLT